ncbi:2-amino-4-hydroxy-6-hydroxymethyldihydropteridine diphosphokinase [Thalassotalea sp. 1_MG-2023]|uniref:2-amino-4-hydroxy-6- hydroxymethyldihydropteridine diphosphokinase n=1 Tax=Thalassotalea sp. 1_MG-2023 TaxID=3062680 RepID=UPI0026E20E9F|nr:2-amino-4-hydroxy-6-hydroxymethyldihydropteridine diphosphokinase [Thalassotalea sp. 1_MG-2023]MDO6427945.1 2-amino-4-hydroxy-6-hydroxymethyldihydropteridine diphosphokinase [Thalassotalea sp. 1_MG-2023]
MPRVYLSLGSNIEREQHISRALDALNNEFSPLSVSQAYDCEPVGFAGNNFLNLVVGFDCDCSIAEIATILRKIEDDNGRVRTGPKFSSRTLDIDILTFGKVVGTVDSVTLPRGEITENAFVLLPLSNVAPDELHPQLNKSYQQLWLHYDKQHQKLSAIEFNWQPKK